MKYMGSKNRIAKELLPIILKDRKPGQWYVEPFVGGANMIDKVDGNRIGSDNNQDVINLLQGLKHGFIPKETYSKEEYIEAKNGLNKNRAEVGYISINCSFGGKYWGRYAGKSNTKTGIRDYTNEAYKNVIKQKDKIQDIHFECLDYKKSTTPFTDDGNTGAIIYCDIPYKGTYSEVEGYGKLKFNHDEFWEWCREKKEEGHTIFVSEYNAPSDFKCVWEKEVKSSLSANGKSGGNKNSIEKLFTL